MHISLRRCTPASSSPRTIAPRSNGCAGTARGPRSHVARDRLGREVDAQDERERFGLDLRIIVCTSADRGGSCVHTSRAMLRWWLSVVLIACGSSTKPESPPPPKPIDAAPVVATDAAVAIDADPFAGHPPRVEAPAGCTIEGDWIPPGNLAFVAGGKPYAKVFQIEHSTATFAGDAAFVDVKTKTVQLAGFLDKTKVRIHAAQAFLVDNWIVPGSKAPLPFRGERDGKLVFEVPMPEGVTAKTARGERPCDDFALDASSEIDPLDAVGVDAIDTATLYHDRKFPLAIELGKPPVVQLRYKGPEPVQILERSGKHARVAIRSSSLNPANDITLVGWIPQSAFHKHAAGYGGSWAVGGDPGAKRLPRAKDSKRVSCKSPTPLVAELAGERRTVGTIAAGFVIEVLATPDGLPADLPAGGDFAEVQLSGAHAELAKDARWLVKQAALADCTSQ